MNLENLTEKQIKNLIHSLAINSEIPVEKKSDTLDFCSEQLKEQRAGGAWKRRLREEGYVI